MAFDPGVEHRHYLIPPPGATWAELSLNTGMHATPKLFMIHTTQVLPHMRPIQVLLILTLRLWQAVFSYTLRVAGKTVQSHTLRLHLLRFDLS
jgi:hypothetical protein